MISKCPNFRIGKQIYLALAQCEKSLVGSNRVVHVWEPHDAAEKKACLMSPHRDLKSLLGWLYSKFSHSAVTISAVTSSVVTISEVTISAVTISASYSEAVSCLVQVIFKFSNSFSMSLFKNKRFMLDEMFQRNASKFAVLLEYENPCSFSGFSLFFIS